MAWFFYEREGWQIAVDAVSKQDAAQLISRQAYGAKFLGTWSPPRAYTPTTAFTTTKRQEQISAAIQRETEEWKAAGSPGKWWD